MFDTLSVTEIAFYSAGLLNILLSIILISNCKAVHVSRMVMIATLANVGWLGSIAWLSPFGEDSIPASTIDALLFWEVAHYSAWIIALIKSAQKYCKNCIPRVLRLSAYGLGLGCSLLAAINLNLGLLSQSSLAVLIWAGIVFSILNLLVLEQLYRNMTNDRLVRLMCIALAFVFLYDAFLFSQNLVLLNLDEDLWQIRASIIMVTTVLISVGVLTLKNQAQQRANINFSQPAVFYTTSLIITGTLLIFLSIGGYYVKVNNASWAAVVYSIIVCSGVISIALTFSSLKVRRKINVLINKHLFNYKYDYRSEWLKLIRLLSQPTEHNKFTERAVAVAASLFKCDGGAIWQKRGSHFLYTEQTGKIQLTDFPEIEADDEFIRRLSKGWVFAPNTRDPELARDNVCVPDWLCGVDKAWLIFPLLVDDELTGFMVLSHVQDSDEPIWEDLDLVKTVGRQIANYLARHEQSELLSQARQFETFNKLSAFVMHDLKNLIAQQSLVVKNAEKHKDNPAFVEDAINTIKNSVDRMNGLLTKLRQNSSEEIKILLLKDVLIEAIKRCQKTTPVPTLVPISASYRIKADFDSLVMVFTHLMHNAQDATPSSGFIDVYTNSTTNAVSITIEDNGEGMSEDFIRTKLFRPFESTKAGKGMGVGVYQAREYIENLGGEFSVESSLSQGSKFTLTIPVVHNQSEE
jgi:putative PEP-CTERM system histidine kinase